MPRPFSRPSSTILSHSGRAFFNSILKPEVWYLHLGKLFTSSHPGPLETASLHDILHRPARRYTAVYGLILLQYRPAEDNINTRLLLGGGEMDRKEVTSEQISLHIRRPNFP